MDLCPPSLAREVIGYMNELPEENRLAIQRRLQRWYGILASPFSSPDNSRSSSPYASVVPEDLSCPPNSPSDFV